MLMARTSRWAPNGTRNPPFDMPVGQLALENAVVTSRESVAPGFWRVALRSPRIARAAGPAQYVATDFPGPFAVRLPLGIWTVDGDEFTLLFREWGERTAQLARVMAGMEISVIGPLGNRFEIPEKGTRATIVAGGIGIVPFWLLGKALLDAGVRTRTIIGARSRSMLAGVDELRALGLTMDICTDDGSAGERGTVLDVLRAQGPTDVLYGCGPPGMLRGLCEHANATNTKCQISMEETFGCSMGTCWGCVVPLRRGSIQATGYPKANDEQRAYDLSRVCTDGTVYSAADVVWQ
jgi:dihydroorotate dehydrogenase electron transfer subunit